MEGTLQVEKARELMIRWSRSGYAKQRGITQVEVNHWLKGEGIDIPWKSIQDLLEGLVKEGKLIRTTSVGHDRGRVAYPPYIYWPKE